MSGSLDVRKNKHIRLRIDLIEDTVDRRVCIRSDEMHVTARDNTKAISVESFNALHEGLMIGRAVVDKERVRECQIGTGTTAHLEGPKWRAIVFRSRKTPAYDVFSGACEEIHINPMSLGLRGLKRNGAEAIDERKLFLPPLAVVSRTQSIRRTQLFGHRRLAA